MLTRIIPSMKYSLRSNLGNGFFALLVVSAAVAFDFGKEEESHPGSRVSAAEKMNAAPLDADFREEDGSNKIATRKDE